MHLGDIRKINEEKCKDNWSPIERIHVLVTIIQILYFKYEIIMMRDGEQPLHLQFEN